MAKTASELLSDYWDQANARGDKKVVYAVMERHSLTPATTAGTLRFWSLSKRQAAQYQAQFPRLLRLIKIDALN